MLGPDLCIIYVCVMCIFGVLRLVYVDGSLLLSLKLLLVLLEGWIESALKVSKGLDQN